jgi:hypothetical protein
MSRRPPDPSSRATFAGIPDAPSSSEPLERDARALFAAGAQEQAPARLRAALLAQEQAPARLRAALLAQARTDAAARAAGELLAGTSPLAHDHRHADDEPYAHDGRRAHHEPYAHDGRRAHHEPSMHGRQPAAPAGRAPARARRRIGLALSAAAGALAAWSLWRLPEVDPGERLLISAEHAPVAVPAAPGSGRAPESALARAAAPPADVPQAAPLQAAPSQAAPLQAAPSQAAPLQAALPDSARAAPSAPRERAQPPTRPRRTARAASPGPAPLAAPSLAPPAAADVRRELELLQSAQRALRAGQHQRALELLSSPGSALERGDFAAEARLMRIEALAGSGRGAEAARLARDFLRLFPHSPLADRARQFGAAAP